MKKEDLIAYIQSSSAFYEFTELNGHSIDQLSEIKRRLSSLTEDNSNASELNPPPPNLKQTE